MRWPAVIALVLYVAAIFLTLPYLPDAVSAVRLRLGEKGVLVPLYGGLVLLAALPALRLFLPPRPPPPRPHLAYVALLLGGLAAALTLASSPIGRVHLAEYGLLGFLVHHALPPSSPRRRWALALVVASLVGLADEAVQHVLPNRVFDWYDVALNCAAALLGILAGRWWAFTGGQRAPSAPAPRVP